ncbi:MAG TPA: hypothetical protein VN181_15185, partial [Thermoanaerobaculia bacterium]|nr:hypothetical protein [Thermoanaerobaculia bacterium]
MKLRLLSLAVALLVPASAFCGGAWVPEPGKGDLQLGFSRKTASSSWDANGNSFVNANNAGVISYHDFRYAYVSGEVGLLRHLSARFLVTYLHGLEGPHASSPRPSSATMRTPALYDLPGAYNRYLFDANGNRRGVSPEWRGVLKHDYTVSYLLSHSFREGRGWMSLETGYTWREGAPADQIPFSAELGWPLAWRGLSLKGSLTNINSLGNDSPRQPDDRFGANATFNFNDASMTKAGVSVIVPLRNRVDVEIGYSQWLRGKSARRY